MVKRLFDIFMSVFCLVILAIPLLFLVLLVRLNLGRPVFFVQLRPGINGKAFEILKFRTMKNVNDSSGELLSDEKRITRFGAFLRESSLDELPELWNVLKGEMSLVGPRPLLMEYLPLYSPVQRRRHEVRPGVTGWAQINGRNAISWEDKFACDLWYVDNQSFLLDMRIVLTTVKKVLSREGVSACGEASVRKFTGNKEV
jgi:lipopolysaccharide/colanic/teichoic acid biosynthesis glycosyltransferase